jgi:hypothetical protein
VKGTCYHDHNWGNVGLNEVLSHWYWGRAHLGEYTLIFAEMNATRRYGEQKIPIFMLAKGNQILTSSNGALHLDEMDFVADPGGRSYPEGLDLDWKDEGCQAHLRLREPRLIESFSLLDLLPAWQRVVGQIVANPYYFRFKADLTLDLDTCPEGSRPEGAGQEGARREHIQEQGRALYELMWLR